MEEEGKRAVGEDVGGLEGCGWRKSWLSIKLNNFLVKEIARAWRSRVCSPARAGLKHIFTSSAPHYQQPSAHLPTSSQLQSARPPLPQPPCCEGDYNEQKCSRYTRRIHKAPRRRYRLLRCKSKFDRELARPDTAIMSGLYSAPIRQDLHIVGYTVKMGIDAHYSPFGTTWILWTEISTEHATSTLGFGPGLRKRNDCCVSRMA